MKEETGHIEPAYIFLDVDGVLNSLRTCVAYGGYKPEHLDRAAILLVDRLCGSLAKAGWSPRIVISSTWRLKYPDLGFWHSLFAGHGCEHTKFVGLTDNFRDNEPNRRGREVAAWISRHDPGAAFVAIDDDGDFLPGQPLAQTSHIWGLGLDEIDHAFHLITGDRLFMSTLRSDTKWKALRSVLRSQGDAPKAGTTEQSPAPGGPNP